jgi:hypothetical protein
MQRLQVVWQHPPALQHSDCHTGALQLLLGKHLANGPKEPLGLP